MVIATKFTTGYRTMGADEKIKSNFQGWVRPSEEFWTLLIDSKQPRQKLESVGRGELEEATDRLYRPIVSPLVGFYDFYPGAYE